MRVWPDHFGVHERGSPVLTTVVDSAPHDRERFERICTVATLAIQIRKAGNQFRNVAACGLDFNGHTDGVAIVFDEKNYRQPQVAGGIERFPKLTFTGSAVSKRDEDDFVVPEILDSLFQFLNELDAISCFSTADRLQKLCTCGR